MAIMLKGNIYLSPLNDIFLYLIWQHNSCHELNSDIPQLLQLTFPLITKPA